MKKLTVILATMFVAVGAFAQGYLNLGNSPTSIITDKNGAALPAGARIFQYAFFVVPDGQTIAAGEWQAFLATSLTPVATNASSGTLGAGRLGNRSAVQIAGADSGTWANVQVVGWSAALGVTYADVKANAAGLANPANLIGLSAPARVQLATSTGNSPVFAFANMTLPAGYSMLSGMTLNPVPEPTVLGLGALGLLGLVAIRRRK